MVKCTCSVQVHVHVYELRTPGYIYGTVFAVPFIKPGHLINRFRPLDLDSKCSL